VFVPGIVRALIQPGKEGRKKKRKEKKKKGGGGKREDVF